MTNLLLFLHLFYQNTFFLVFASFVLEPDAYDARAQAGHFDELLFHERVWPWIGAVACAQRMQLFFIENSAHARRLVLAMMMVMVVMMMMTHMVLVACRGV
jgi:hypothetical protein